MTRGISLNNPGNVRISQQNWQGKVTPSRDPDFETFDTPEHGIRVIAKILLACFTTHGLNTIGGIIEHYAPSTENDTQAYAKDVSDRTGWGVDEKLGPDVDTLSDLVYGIIWHENGCCPYSDDQIGDAVDDALEEHEAAQPATHNID